MGLIEMAGAVFSFMFAALFGVLAFGFAMIALALAVLKIVHIILRVQERRYDRRLRAANNLYYRREPRQIAKVVDFKGHTVLPASGGSVLGSFRNGRRHG